MKLLLPILILSFTLLFCTTSNATTERPFVVILDWFINPTHAPILIAQEKGFFKEQGLDVQIVAPADPSDTAKMVAIGKATVGIGSDPELLLLINEGLPLVRMGALIDQPLEAVTANAAADIKTLHDLKGKTVGYSIGGIEKVILSIMLRNVGLTLNDVTLVNVHYDLVEALLSTRVDAITGSLRNYEVPALHLKNFPITVFYPEKYGMPSYAELNYIINSGNQNDLRLVKFLHAIQKATVYIKEHPQRSWSLLIKKYPEMDDQLNQISWRMTYTLFANDPAYTNQKNFTKLITTMQATNWLTKKVHYQQCVITLLPPKAK